MAGIGQGRLAVLLAFKCTRLTFGSLVAVSTAAPCLRDKGVQGPGAVEGMRNQLIGSEEAMANVDSSN